MGNCNFKSSDNDKSLLLSAESFKFLYPIGKGGFGVVWRATHRFSNIDYAIKEMHKGRIIIRKSVNSVFNEFRYLSTLNSKLIANMHYAFQDKYKLYLVMDLMEDKDLRYHINANKQFKETTTRFIVASIALGMDYLHQQEIIHRDIKPENILLDGQGFLCLSDLGIARKFSWNNCKETSGTPGYMAPEVIQARNHGKTADYYALGVIAYECVMGKRPYQGKDRQLIRQQMKQNPAKIDLNKLPNGLSLEGADFINRLLQVKPQNRLGYHGFAELKQHPWFRAFNWEKLESRTLISPFKTSQKINQPYNYKECEREENDELEKVNRMLNTKAFQELFKGYYYQETPLKFSRGK